MHDAHPKSTTFATIGDTVVASTTGDVPDALVRRLAVDWRIQTNTARDIIGDVYRMAVARLWGGFCTPYGDAVELTLLGNA